MTKQEEIKVTEESQQIGGNIHSALLLAQSSFGSVKKDAANTHFKNRYSTLNALFEAAFSALHANGIVVSQPVVGDNVGYFVRTILHHAPSGTELTTDIPLLMGKQDMQQFKSASTYARRIGFENLTGISAGDDDDDAETNRKDTAFGAAMGDAWRQSVEDSIPENATPVQKAKIFADAICADFKGNGKGELGEKALKNRWAKHRKIVESLDGRFPDLYGAVTDCFETEMLRATGQDGGGSFHAHQ